MKNKEIKYLLNEMKDTTQDYIGTNGCKYQDLLREEIDLLLSYIEQLEEENKYLKQLCQTQNDREYRSKFLKEFQEEFGKNVFPDYDEIYKRYDKLKKENKQLKKLCDKYEEEHKTIFEEWKKDINIIDELSQYLEEDLKQQYRDCGHRNNIIREVYNKLNELKGDNK